MKSVFLFFAFTVILSNFPLLSCNDHTETKKEEERPAKKDRISAKILSFDLIDKDSTVYQMQIDTVNFAITNTDSVAHTVDISAMKAVFTTNDTSIVVKIGDIEQISGETVNDFSQNLRYDLFVADTLQKSYTISLLQKNAPPVIVERKKNDFTTFYFAEPAFLQSRPLTIDTAAATVSNATLIPYALDISALKATFVTAEPDAEVFVGSKQQRNGITANDFTSDVVYTIKSSDGSDKNYTVSLHRDRSRSYSNPVIPNDAPDPTVIRAGNEFYLYGTGNITKVYKSTNMRQWTYLGEAFTQAGRPNFVENAGMWAPDINYIGGQYVLYYAMSVWGGEWTCGIGVAVSNTPQGPFRTVSNGGKMFISSEINVQNSIDCCIFEENGKVYMFWGSFSGIYYTELTADGLSVKNLSKRTRIAGTAFEGTYIYKRGNYYYLFASVGSCCEGDNSTYRTVVGRSTSLLGPYLAKDGGQMLDNHYTVLLSGDGENFIGPGHNARIITDDLGNDWMLYHAYEKGKGGRKVLLDRVVWDSSGWCSISNGHPSLSSDIAPYFE